MPLSYLRKALLYTAPATDTDGKGQGILFTLGKMQRLYTPGLGEQSGVLKDSMVTVYLGYRNINEILK